ncbi:adhesion G-protein coupled receptor F3 [Cheilinus undulatus]|uniref:adhesion G-protein coupled receptor F3 n=1 Tax=Cheilinus undulatus TaxID=241271 RepID=UPI001BD3B4AE|nr:adhesion G-protein coupled receptor F3 [Cheilinus undulatus]XP_041668690.1 adhesion G-protein coupled receptor F3 [Cheilinus undulatus]XP_041668691.1 adhesion G-protein coupled receptor F3 [Cheilinus undulatus]
MEGPLRIRMWTFLILLILGLNVCQTAGQENSTQMFYIKLEVDSNAIPNVTHILQPFVSNKTLTVDDLKITTTCKNNSNKPDSVDCECTTGHKWREEVCKSQPSCCSTDKCTLSRPSMCVSNTSVGVSGSLTLNGLTYAHCLDEKKTTAFLDCNYNLTTEMKIVYSTLRGFDNVTISKYRSGSVIADFDMFLAYEFKPKDLLTKSLRLNEKLESLFKMETTGVVRLSIPDVPVPYNSKNDLTCTIQQDLQTKPEWSLRRNGLEFEITTGTESKVSIDTLKTNVALSNASELWAGEYTCLYRQEQKNVIIDHKASGELDVCLKPDIFISIDPGFPHCQKNSDTPAVTIKCDVGGSGKNYNVTWSHENAKTLVPRPNDVKKGLFIAITNIACDPNKPTPKITCSLRNRCNQTTDASIIANIIFANDAFCETEGEWKKTKAGFTSRLKCKNQAGIRQRRCDNSTTKAKWEPEVSNCVNQNVDDVLRKANIVDIGLGSVHDNAAQVFSELQNVTNITEKIDTVPNLNASVNVLHTLSLKLPQQQDTVVDDFLGSSSNLLDRSLNKSWSASANERNSSLAETYLGSVEHLIQMINITQRYKKKNVEVEARNCLQGSHCINKVFSNTVSLKGRDPGNVKTAGFQELEKYLPNNFEEFQPNSIVISTTTERNISDSVEVEIKFHLLQSRRRNFDMKCASWDNVTRGWSTHKCEWRQYEYSDIGVCVCQHLSSFAILMGKRPLRVKWMTQTTYVGLSVSVVSLIISLVVELMLWSAVVKTNTSYLRHTAHVNICLCLLVADCCFLASSKPDLSTIVCKTLVVLKHFCYLAMFFWMLWLSSTLLHQTVFLFHNVSKKIYLKFAVFLGYVCPLLIVVITILVTKGGAEGHYYTKDGCWLVYTAPFKGSIHTFIIPIGIIVFFNVFSMVVVILKLLDHPTNASVGDKEKKAAVTVMRTVVLLTPIFGITWIFGFAVMILDLTVGVIAYVANYAFILLNSFQGFFIMLTVCLGDTMTREELWSRLTRKVPAETKESITASTVSK